MATTPAEWLPILAKRLDARQARIAKNRSYSNGNAPLPEMGKNTRATWKAFQKKARTNYGGLACESLGGRMVPNGVRVGTSTKTPAVLAARRVWRDNRLDVVFGDAISTMLTTSVSYLIVGIRDGQPIITAETPEQVITASDPTQPWRARAALKAWRDPDTGLDHALVWTPGERQHFTRKSTNSNGTPIPQVDGDWEALDAAETYAGGVPVFVLENKDGVAEFEPHIDVIDRINLGKLQRLVTTAMQAFKQRALKGGLDATDEDDNAIDWAKILEPAPGALWDLPEGIDVWESPATDIRPLLDGEKVDARDFAAVMRTPLDVFVPEGQNQSATGAANAHKGEIQKAKDRIARAGAPMEGALLAALQVLGLDDGETVQVTFETPEHVSLTEKSAAAAQAKAGGKSQRWIDEHIWGMSPDEIDQEETDRASEQLLTGTLIGGAGGNGNA
ncbi:phage portal protein [Curtobacterium flaccumfaciens pv. flaccumfaciens]|uniref:Phage portal protein n=1 Tax=Curtobacterium flaccumfaciens pv. flaccumfaciens TaxID=138532 RepID=A0A9Q2ZPU6_9MICO|nr:phage portal protein [Curtobacterium flaccumfaciens]MBT1542468.1 phage portal protein [Curtobacterium flaccumfaciens pv. flaccumfaciens]